MRAITRLYESGLSRAEVAAGVGCTAHLIGMYERFDRFPSRVRFTCIVELAESRGIKLLARDFLAANSACEDSVGQSHRPRRNGKKKAA